MMTHFAPPDGPRLHVDDSGGTGLAMLFQHGLCGDARQVAEVFPPQTLFRRITLECRGHGASEPGDTSAFSIATFTGDVIALIEKLGLGPVVVGGISMGAAIAMRIAIRRPDLVRGLVIARPAWSTAAAPPNMAPNAEVGELLFRLPSEEARGAFLAGATAKRLAAEAPDNLVSLTGFFSRQPFAVTSALLRLISASGPDVSAAQLKAIAVPTLVIANRMDRIHPIALAEEIAGLIPTARLVEIAPKALDRAKYAADFQLALATFLKGFSQ
jgi:pimeloyl-ACP methyl ester carboxylesterase